MNKHIYHNIRRMTAGIISFMVLFVVMFSSVYIAKESLHDCHGDGCPVCACIEQCEDMLHQLGNGILAVAIITVALAVFITSGILPILDLTYETQKKKKIRLNN